MVFALHSLRCFGAEQVETSTDPYGGMATNVSRGDSLDVFGDNVRSAVCLLMYVLVYTKNRAP